MLDKLNDINSDYRSEALDLSIRSIHLLTFAEHLHSDPSLWELTLEYTAACGIEGKERLAELVMRVPIDFESVKTTGPVERSQPADLDTMVQTGPEGAEVDDQTKQEERWTERMEKLITICKDYGLEDVICSVCKSVARMLSRRSQYGLAVQYSIMGRDGRGVGRIADQLLEEYLLHGPETFCAQVATIPNQYLVRPANSDPTVPIDAFASRLEFLGRYADYHDMCRRGEKRQAARLLVALFTSSMMPRWWWGILLLDAGGMLEDDELLITMEDTFELLRHLEEIFIRTEQGSGADYLSALQKMLGDGSDENDALKQLEVVRLTLARYLARCSTKPASTWATFY
jgi:nuclear pore complex protein Nup85